jgi:hypothetical protein
MEQRTLKNVNNYLNTNIYSCLETSSGLNYKHVMIVNDSSNIINK